MNETRSRAYESYVSSHQGDVAGAGRVVDFRTNFLHLLPSSSDTRILDVGCGQGIMLQVLKGAGYTSAVGIDTSPQQIELAHKAGFDSAVCIDLFAFAESNTEQFDVIFAIDFVEHFDRGEVLDVFQTLYSLLSDRGRLILRTPNGCSPFSGRIQFSDITHGMIYTERSLQQISSLVGFRSLRVYPAIPTGLRFGGIRRMLWRLAETVIKVPLILETGKLSGHIVTQNLVAVATR